MDQAHDLPPRRRLPWIAVVIATVVLSALAVAGGLALGSADRGRQAAEQDRQRQEQQQQQQPTAEPVTPQVTATGRPCRKETQVMGVRAGATGELTEVLVLRTSRSVVWICEDQAGRLYYHANKGGERARWVEGETALFLDGITALGDAYQGQATDGTRFSVNADRLVIIHKDGSEEEQKAA